MSSLPPTLGYASPTPLAPAGDLFRDGQLLVVRNGRALPERCVLCAGPAAEAPPLTLRFTWDPSFRITRVFTLQMRRQGQVGARLCAKHLARYRRHRLIGLIGMGISCVAMLASGVVALASESSDVPRFTPHGIAGIIAGFALFIVFSFIFTLGTRTLGCSRIEGDYLYLEGAADGLLEALPPLPADLVGPPG